MSSSTDNSALPPETRIDQFVIERSIGGGGFSIVYLARRAGSKKRVVIKEYMPRKLARRADDGRSIQTIDEQAADKFARGRRLFFQEASTLVTLEHPNIVNVVSFFRANGTVYMVMAHEQGINLQDYIKRHNGAFSEKLIRRVFVGLLEGLKYLHGKGLLHLDIKPGNVYLRAGGDPLLLDFGAVHEFQQTRQHQGGQVLTRGFSPIEQSNQGGYVGPWTDIYALGATMRACIEGGAPQPAEERYLEDKLKPALELFRRRYSRNLLHAIDWSMEVDPLERPQNVDQLLELLAREEDPGGGSMLGRIASSLPWSKS